MWSKRIHSIGSSLHGCRVRTDRPDDMMDVDSSTAIIALFTVCTVRSVGPSVRSLAGARPPAVKPRSH